MSNQNDPLAGARQARSPNTILLWAALAAIGFVVLVGANATSEAKDTRVIDIAYLAVFGDGPIARAWYDGAPSPGVPVQDALDHFAKEGYRVVRTTDALRNVSAPGETSFAIILERVR